MDALCIHWKGAKHERPSNSDFCLELVKGASMNITLITSAHRLTKKWRLVDGEAKIEKAGQMTKGTAEPLLIDSPDALIDLLQRLHPEQALTYGVPMDGQAHPVVTQRELPNAVEGSIARDNEHFRWPAGAGWLMLDYDPARNAEPLCRDDLLAALTNVCPALSDAPMVWGVSSSSHIVNSETGEAITGLRGQRVYVLVADARDIPRAGKALFNRLWLAGHGRYDISKAGTPLERTLIDAAVWQACRLDFAAPPVTVRPLETHRPAPEPINGEAPPLDSVKAIASLTPTEEARLKDIKAAIRGDEALMFEQQSIRDAWVTEKLDALPPNLSKEEREAIACRLRAAVHDYRLWGDFELIHQSGHRVTVGEVMDDPDRWHGKRFADPLDPGEDQRIAWLNLRSGGRPYLFSHAHGGQRFTLLRPTMEMQVSQGNAPQNVTSVLERMRHDSEVFERAGQMVRLADGELIPVEQPWLRTHLEQRFQFKRYDGREKDWRTIDCPQDLAARVMAARGNWKLPKVAGIVTFPVMRPDGSIIERPGYDAATDLLYLDNNPERPTPSPLSGEALRRVLARIWEPFEAFPFDGDLSRAVFFAGLLTTVCRPALPTAPGWLIRAYAPGTGKTLLSECLMLIAGAPMSALPLPENNQEEIEKRLFASLMTGRAGLVLDNLTGVLESAAMCAMLTSPEPEGRILGKSEVRTIQNRALFVLNGNNVSPGGDLFRRVLPVTLDANTERPETRSFLFDPRALIQERLQAYRADLLSVLLSYRAAGAPLIGKGGFGSFDAWESLVRQCVCWLIRENLTPAPMADPLDVLELSKAEDPHHLQHIAVLEAWHARYGDRPIQVKDLAELMRLGDLGRSPEESALCDALSEVGVPPRGRGEFDTRYFSGWLRRNRGRVVSGLRLDRGQADHKHGHRWLVQRA